MADGKCNYCGRNPRGTKTICSECINKRNQIRIKKIKAGICTANGCNNKTDGKRLCVVCSQKISKRIWAGKMEVLNHYGAKCACKCGCKTTNPRHLTIDHINNDGAAQRRIGKFNGGLANYRKIVKAGFPSDIQILCWNCNCSKEYYGGCI